MLTKPQPAEREGAIEALRGFIADGGYAPGDRLPPERVLTSDLGMTRTTLRRALDALEREGAIWRHVGRGTFVSAGPGHGSLGGLAEISHQLTPVRMMRARLSIEPAIAREAAINASSGAIARIRSAIERAENVTTWEDYELRDDEFHRAVAEATDNILLLSLFDQLQQVHRAVTGSAVERQSLRPPPDHTSFAEHRSIAAAVEAHDAAGAQEAMRRHIGSVSARLFGEV